MGREHSAFAEFLLTAAQRRCQSHLLTAVGSFLRRAPKLHGEAEIHKFLKSSDNDYCNPFLERTLPLGERAGTPATAATVDLAHVLDRSRPDLARQVRNPSSLLLKPPERPRTLNRPFTYLHKSYPTYVQRNVVSGMQRLVPIRKVKQHHGKPIISGAFAVPKNDKEDRAIAALTVNEFIDPSKLWKPLFGQVQRLRCVTSRGKKLRVSKKRCQAFLPRFETG